MIHKFSAKVHPDPGAKGVVKPQKAPSCRCGPTNSTELQRFGDRLVRTFLSMLGATYVALCHKSIMGSGLFGSCVVVQEDPLVRLMAHNTNVECGSPAHAAYQGIALAAGIVYVVGIPALFLGIVWHLHRRKLKADERSLARFGVLYDLYENEDFYW